MVDRREQDTTLYLTQMLSSKRKPIEQSLFDKDPTLHGRVDQYQEDFLEFLRQPTMLSLGGTLRQLDIRTELLVQSHNQRASELDPIISSSRQQREDVSEQLRQMEERIKGIGRGRILQGDLGSLVGRIQVQLGYLQDTGRLSLSGKWLSRLFGIRQIHPQIEFHHNQLSQLGLELDQLETERKQSSDGFVTERVNLGRQTHTQQERLFHQLDQWVVDQPEYFLIHYLYFGRPPIDRLLKRKDLTEQDLAYFLATFRTLNLLDRGYKDLLTGVANTKSKKMSRQPEQPPIIQNDRFIPVVLRIKGKEFELSDIALAKDEFVNLRGGLSATARNRLWNKFAQALLYESFGSHHQDSTILKADDMQKRLDGNWRLRVGVLRVVSTLDSLEDGRLVFDEVKIVHRDDPRYY